MVVHEHEAEHSVGGGRTVDAALFQIPATLLLQEQPPEIHAVPTADLPDPAGLSQDDLPGTDRIPGSLLRTAEGTPTETPAALLDAEILR